jgi:peptidoglycan hydrolase-like protein with peptidoglycan-binding domain
MATHTTNTPNTFVRLAGDSPVTAAQIPPLKASGPTAANIQYDMVLNHPYKYSSDDVIFEVYAQKQDIARSERAAAREAFFAKGQPCMRASALTKRYGWGVHSDPEGKIALVPAGTPEYEQFAAREDLKQVQAMRTSRVGK